MLTKEQVEFYRKKYNITPQSKTKEAPQERINRLRGLAGIETTEPTKPTFTERVKETAPEITRKLGLAGTGRKEFETSKEISDSANEMVMRARQEQDPERKKKLLATASRMLREGEIISEEGEEKLTTDTGIIARGAKAQEDIEKGDLLRAPLRLAGAGAGVFQDIVGAGFESLGTIPAIRTGLEKAKGLANKLNLAPDEETKQALSRIAGSIYEKWQEFESNNPEIAQDLKDASNIALTIADFVGLSAGKKLGKEGLERVVKNSDEILTAIKTGTKPIVSAIDKTSDLAKKGYSKLFPNRSTENIARNILGKTTGVANKQVAREMFESAKSGLALVLERVPKVKTLKEGGFNKLYEVAETFQKEIGNRLGIELKRIRGLRKSEPAENALNSLIDMVEGASEKAPSKELSSRVSKWRSLLERNKTAGLSAEDINNIKIDYSKNSRMFGGGGQELGGISPEASRLLRKDLRREVLDMAKQSGIDEKKLISINDNWAMVSDTLDFLNRQVLARENLISNEIKTGILSKIGDVASKLPLLRSGREFLTSFLRLQERSITIADIEKKLFKLVNEFKKSGISEKEISNFVNQSMAIIDENVNLVSEELARLGTRKALPEPSFIPLKEFKGIERSSKKIIEQLDEAIKRNDISKSKADFFKNRLKEDISDIELESIVKQVEEELGSKVKFLKDIKLGK